MREFYGGKELGTCEEKRQRECRQKARGGGGRWVKGQTGFLSDETDIS